MTTLDAGDYREATLVVSPYDGTTSAVLTVVDPDGAETTPAVTSSDDDPETGQQTWTSEAYELDQPGEWVERWTVTGTGASAERRTLLVAPDPTDTPDSRVYATTADLARWLGSAPPSGARRALAAASRDIDQLLNTAHYDVDSDGMPTNADVIAALRDATCAQAQHAQAKGDQFNVGAGTITSGRIGQVQFQRRGAGGKATPDHYSRQAKQILHQAGLTGHGPWAW